MVVSMMFSPFLLSVSMWGFIAMALWHAARQCKAAMLINEGRWRSNTVRVLQQLFQNWWQHRIYPWMGCLFFLVALSAGWSDDLPAWLVRTRVRLPFFILPLAFANLPRLSPTQWRIPLYVLLVVAFFTCIGVGIRLWLNFDAIMDGLSKGQPIPVPRHHIRFNLMLVTAILSGGWLWLEKFRLKFAWENTFQAFAIVFLFVFIHILSVRSGIAALYAMLLVALVWYLIKTRKWALGLSALALLLLAPIIAVQSIPSLQQRLSYMRYDWERFRSESGYNYSDSERWLSLQTGLMLWQQHPLLGTGAGDLENDTKQLVRTDFPTYKNTPRMPHNQFVYILASTGLLGLLLSLPAFFYPFFYKKYRQFPPWLLFQVIVLVSFMVEYTIETAIGVAFYLFYTLWFMKTAEA